MRLLAILNRIHRWLFPDKRSEWERKRERAFIEAVNQLRNYSVTDQGGLSMDPKEIRDYVIARRQELSPLVDSRYRENSSIGSAEVAAGAFVEVVSWRRLSDEAAIRYACLQALDGRGFSVASARHFSAEDAASPRQDEDSWIARRLIGAAGELSLEWHPTLEAAIEAHEKAI